jgi:glycopeptide antibiotics resistance protein
MHEFMPKKLITISLGVIGFLICIILFIAGLYPFNFKPQNKVEWLPDENGIRFFGKGIIYGSNPFNSSKDRDVHGAVSIEFWAQPNPERNWGLPRILAFCDKQKAETFFIEQWRSELILRYEKITGTGSEEKRYRQIGLPNAFSNDVKHFISVASGTAGTAFYLDGQPAKNYPDFFLPSENIELSEYMVLGNSPLGQEYWRGDLFGLAFYNRYLTRSEISGSYLFWKQNGYPCTNETGLVALYLFDEGKGNLIKNHRGPAPDLEIPKSFRPLKRVVLRPPWKDFRVSRSYAMDVFINVMGFVPFGFFFTALFLNITPLPRRRVYFLILVLGGAISLAIELAQVYLPTRNSSLGDLIYNIAGTAAGIILYSFWLAILKAKKRA